jgi:hypothetical protein
VSNQDKKGTKRYYSSGIPSSSNTGKPQFNLKETGKLILITRKKAIKPSINNIRYVDSPVSNRARTTSRKTNIKAIDTRRQTFSINRIRYEYSPVGSKSRTNKRDTVIKTRDTKKQTSKIKNRKGFFASPLSFNSRKSTSYKKRIS